MQNSDIYCFGKIIQFIMAHIKCEPYLSKKEEYKLLRIVKKCLEENPKNQYENIPQIQHNFIRNKKREYNIPQIQVKWKWGIIVVVVLIIALLVLGMSKKKEVKDINLVQSEKINQEKILDEYWNIGIRYFLEFKDYEKAENVFRNLIKK